MKKIKITKINIASGASKVLSEYDSLKDAQVELRRYFTCDLGDYADELCEKNGVNYKLADGRIITPAEAANMEEISNYELVFPDVFNSYDDRDNNRYEIEAPKKAGRKPINPKLKKRQVSFYCTPEQEKKLRKAAEKILGQ